MAASEEEGGGQLPNRQYQRSTTQIWEDGADVGNQPTNADNITYEELWERYAANPNFFGQVELAKDGGLSEADELIGIGRYLSAVQVIGFVILNVYFLISNSLRFLLPGESANQEEILLFTTRYIFTGFKGVQIIASVEILLVLYVLVCFSIQIWNMLRPSSELVQWYAVQELFWNVIPQASTISTLKFLNFVTPAVVLPDFMNLVGNLSDNNACVKLGRVFTFLGIRMLLAIAGFDAFLFKMQTVRGSAMNYQTTEDWGDAITLLLTLFAFLNQLLGIVQLGWFVRKRIFAFIFAGEDGFMTEQEDALKETWESMLARRIWKDLPWYQAIAAYLSYSDMDFQKLALETVEKAPQAPQAPQVTDVEMEQSLSPNAEEY